MQSRQEDCKHSEVCRIFTSESEFHVPEHTEGDYSAADNQQAAVEWGLMDSTQAPVCPQNHEVHWTDIYSYESHDILPPLWIIGIVIHSPTPEF